MNVRLRVVPAVNLRSVPVNDAGMSVDMSIDFFEIFDAMRLP
jgi:hypothetical protein